ncbi:ATPase inhibitor mai-2, mitochondrial-like [Parasteatoda tepidariorum]|uniref:ATPase inhibitor mai-2, mitochondrial-like n=1 Tax=Parasteatoda tepidariorum TaxID=114398 RepID=UPI00077F9DEA
MLRTIRLRYAISKFGRSEVTDATNGGWGSGTGRGGGSGGSVRDAGGSFGKMQVAREEEYFRKLQHQQIKALRHQLQKEIDHQESEIKRREGDIRHYKEQIEDLDRTQHELDNGKSN